MAGQMKLLGSTSQTPIDNKQRKIVVLPGQPSKDFIITANCRIINVGGRIGMSAADLPGDSGGSYSWSSSSDKITLVNTTGPSVVITARSKPGSARDSETITVTRRDSGGAKTTKTVTLTVARVTFGPATTQRYGYDDFDTTGNRTDDHISVKSEGETFVAVIIEGGALGTDFNFVCDNEMICSAEPAPGTARFDLHLKAKAAQKEQTVLKAKIKCPSPDPFAAISVHVYTEKFVKVVIAKVGDSRRAATALKYPTADYASHQAAANEASKEGVVRYEFRNMETSNSVTDVPYDISASGMLDYDINGVNSGLEFTEIDNVLTFGGGEIRVAIVRNMRSLYYLDRPAKRGDMTISVRGDNIFKASMPLGSGAALEQINVTGNTGKIGRLAAPLKFDHPIGDFMEFPAAAWAGNPIIIAEGDAGLEVVKWTILHEAGHTALKLRDVVDTKNVMNADIQNTDHRLRYCPRVSEYKPTETENQWDTIPRPELP